MAATKVVRQGGGFITRQGTGVVLRQEETGVATTNRKMPVMGAGK